MNTSYVTQVSFFSYRLNRQGNIRFVSLHWDSGGNLCQYVYSETEVITMQVMKAQGGAEIYSIHSQPWYCVAD